VDDDDDVRAAVQDLLQSQGIPTYGFSSAEQFLRSRQRSKASCLVLDMRLPGMSGVELLHHLCDIGLSVPVIYCTAEMDAAGKLRSQLLQAGAMAVLGKPFEAGRLLSLVRAALEAGQRR
jgi:FixJ family two-component response regulator